MNMPVEDRMAKARAAIKSGKKTEPWQVDLFFKELKANGGNIYQAAKKAQMRDSTARYYFKKASDPRYANLKGIAPEMSERSWIRRSRLDVKLNELVGKAIGQIDEQLKTASPSETCKTLRELLSLRRYIENPPRAREKTKINQETAPPKDDEEDVATLLARAAARKAKEKSLPLGDTTPEAPVAEATAEM